MISVYWIILQLIVSSHGQIEEFMAFNVGNWIELQSMKLGLIFRAFQEHPLVNQESSTILLSSLNYLIKLTLDLCPSNTSIIGVNIKISLESYKRFGLSLLVALPCVLCSLDSRY